MTKNSSNALEENHTSLCSDTWMIKIFMVINVQEMANACVGGEGWRVRRARAVVGSRSITLRWRAALEGGTLAGGRRTHAWCARGAREAQHALEGASAHGRV